MTHKVFKKVLGINTHKSVYGPRKHMSTREFTRTFSKPTHGALTPAKARLRY